MATVSYQSSLLSIHGSPEIIWDGQIFRLIVSILELKIKKNKQMHNKNLLKKKEKENMSARTSIRIVN